MEPRAFVVMPFQTKSGTDDQGKSIEVDFERVYFELLEPALKAAGCEPFRADCEVSSGDIRTDMFFELVTADVVVADLSMPNPNVYYELGIRDGVCPRGVFIIQGGFTATRPFDVASDRSFSYPGKLFLVNGQPPNKLELDKALDKLTRSFKDALAEDNQTTGSPLYAHLPNLKPVDWQNIETTKARYFGALSRNWLEMVERARDRHRPGHIITLAHDAPTRLHRSKILACAARSLIGLCQFKAAEKVLRDILHMLPDDLDAQHQLGVVLVSQGEVELAKAQMNRVLEQHRDSQAGAVQGLVYRVAWYLQWTNDPNPRERATSDSELLLSAIASFYTAQRRHPEQYLNGYNALLLLSVADHLGVKHCHAADEIEDLTTFVRYSAVLAREGAVESESLFWSAVCLSGLAMMKDDSATSLQWMNNALPSATLFDLQVMNERLDFLEKLQYRPAIVASVRKAIFEKLALRPSRDWQRVIVFSGYEIGESERFPVASVTAVEQKIHDTLKTKWNVGPGDLAICSGATAGDVLFAETCHALGAKLRLLQVDPSADQAVEDLLDPIASEWASRGNDLVNLPGVEVWHHFDELGEPGENTSLLARNNRWIVNTASMEADATAQTRLFALVLWDGALRADNPEDPSFFMAEVGKSRRRGDIVPINPAFENQSRAVG